ncbi:hypothetical protein AB0O22_17465 [Streptomyces sp. NPDC091204]|uniref:hypothetical protein n=1 Tax=Streptomyces sp. NPDC091204 TaxID=3155299 RepID=UPI00341D64C1
MTLSTLYGFLSHDVLGNILSTLLIAGAGYTAKKIRAKARNQKSQTDHPTP